MKTSGILFSRERQAGPVEIECILSTKIREIKLIHWILLCKHSFKSILMITGIILVTEISVCRCSQTVKEIIKSLLGTFQSSGILIFPPFWGPNSGPIFGRFFKVVTEGEKKNKYKGNNM